MAFTKSSGDEIVAGLAEYSYFQCFVDIGKHSITGLLSIESMHHQHSQSGKLENTEHDEIPESLIFLIFMKSQLSN